MTDKQREIGNILSKIADELNITPTMYDKAVESYEAVGKWLGDGIDYTVEIMPQGSMNLGTTVRPINEDDDYDIDLVCLLHEGYGLEAGTIKRLVGNRLKEHSIYHEKLEDEGKRCWTMSYAGFHMDILPCVPAERYFVKEDHTQIRLTHKLYDGIYIDKYSNPYGYRLWFEKQMWDLLVERKQQYATANNTVIDRVPNFKIRTPLQQAIQLLKRHRDIVFQNNDDLAPASIIITTLAAKAYGNQIDLYEALSTILADMASYIELRNGVAWIPNPVMTVENFAEKWQAEPEKAKAFYSWLKVAKKQLLDDPISMFGLDAIGKHYIDILGELPVKRALNTLGEETRSARSSGGLFVNGLTGGVTKSFSDSSKKVKEHTFFG